MSHHHVKIEFDEAHDQYWAVDNESRGGVCIDGNVIVGKAGLQNGARILIGKAEILFTLDDPIDCSGYSRGLDALSRPKKAGEREAHTELDCPNLVTNRW